MRAEIYTIIIWIHILFMLREGVKFVVVYLLSNLRIWNNIFLTSNNILLLIYFPFYIDVITNTSQSPQKLQFNRFMTQDLSVEESKTAQVAVAKTAQTVTKMENSNNWTRVLKTDNDFVVLNRKSESTKHLTS